MRDTTPGTKLSQHTHPRHISGTKLSPHTHPRHISGTKLSPHTRNGSIWHFLCAQGEFCTVVTTKKPSRESFVPLWLAQHRAGRILYRMRGRDRASQHNNTPGTTGVKAPEGPEGSEEPQDPAAVPGAAGPGRGAGGCGGARPHYPQTTSAPSPSKFRMQFPHDTDRCTLKNRGISTIRLQYLKYTQGNCMRNWRESGPWGHTQHPDAVAHDIYGMEERPVGPHAASHRRACPPSARSAAAQRPGRATTSDILQERLTVRAVPDGDGLGDGPQRVGDHGLEAAVGHELLDFG